MTRQELYDLVWSTPMKTLAAQFGISDVGLKKTCARAEIPTPDRGHWAKRAAGKKTSPVALPPRPPGMSDEVVIARGRDYWYVNLTREELLGPLPPQPEFPESLEAVRERIARAIGKVTVPKKVLRWHPTIEQLLKEDDRRREQQSSLAYQTSWNSPLFDSPLERRRLRILNSLFLAAERMSGRPRVDAHEPRSIQVGFYQQYVGITLNQQALPRHRGHNGKQIASKENSRLSLSFVDRSESKADSPPWQDGDGVKIEERLTEIAIELVLTAERHYRENEIRSHQWRVKRRADLEEEARQREIAAQRAERARQERSKQARIDRLLKDARKFEQANTIRQYVEAVCFAQAGKTNSAAEFEQWREWSLAEADRVDPTIGGRYLLVLVDDEGTIDGSGAGG